MGLGYDTPSSTNTANNSGLSAQSKINAMVLQKIQALVAANPQFLTSGIPNQLLSQLLMQPMKVRPELKMIKWKHFFKIFFLGHHTHDAGRRG